MSGIVSVLFCGITQVLTSLIFSKGIYILYIYFACLSVGLYPINVKTAEPIGPKFYVRPRVTQKEVYGWLIFQKFSLTKFSFQNKNHKITLFLPFPKWSLLYCGFNITREMHDFAPNIRKCFYSIKYNYLI